MAHKHELQDLLFTMEDSLSSLNVIAADITRVITKLEQAGCKLQNITVRLLSTCIATMYIICYDLYS